MTENEIGMIVIDKAGLAGRKCRLWRTGFVGAMSTLRILILVGIEKKDDLAQRRRGAENAGEWDRAWGLASILGAPASDRVASRCH